MFQETLRIEKKINADALRIFQAWLNPDQFALWFLSGDSVTIESASLDPRPGGKFTINMMLNGKILPHEGEYITIDEPNKLVFTWRSQETQGLDTLVTVTFTPIYSPDDRKSVDSDSRDDSGHDDRIKNKTISSQKSSSTLITLVHERLSSEDAIGKHRFGWTSILETLDLWITKE